MEKVILIAVNFLVAETGVVLRSDSAVTHLAEPAYNCVLCACVFCVYDLCESG